MNNKMRITLAKALAELYSRHCDFPVRYNEKINEMIFSNKKVFLTKDNWEKMRKEIGRDCFKYYYREMETKGSC